MGRWVAFVVPKQDHFDNEYAVFARLQEVGPPEMEMLRQLRGPGGTPPTRAWRLEPGTEKGGRYLVEMEGLRIVEALPEGRTEQ